LQVEIIRSQELENVKQLNYDLDLQNKRNEKRIQDLEGKLRLQMEVNQRNKEEHSVLNESLRSVIGSFDEANKELSKRNKELQERNKKLNATVKNQNEEIQKLSGAISKRELPPIPQKKEGNSTTTLPPIPQKKENNNNTIGNKLITGGGIMKDKIQEFVEKKKGK
jgi:chromosome segregation ATPase